jgi:CheY-like chemotaxis protein
MVERLGYSATGINDSRAALALFKQNPNKYNIVMTNQTMPEMTGIDLARALISVRPDIPVILITGYRNMVDAAIAREAGINLIVAKPMTTVELGLAIKELLTRRHDEGQPYGEMHQSPMDKACRLGKPATDLFHAPMPRRSLSEWESSSRYMLHYFPNMPLSAQSLEWSQDPTTQRRGNYALISHPLRPRKQPGGPFRQVGDQSPL